MRYRGAGEDRSCRRVNSFRMIRFGMKEKMGERDSCSIYRDQWKYSYGECVR